MEVATEEQDINNLPLQEESTPSEASNATPGATMSPTELGQKRTRLTRPRRGGKKKAKGRDGRSDPQVRAERKYVKSFVEGRPVAPLNSTQFIMADHGSETPLILQSPARDYLSDESSDTDYGEESDGTVPELNASGLSANALQGSAHEFDTGYFFSNKRDFDDAYRYNLRDHLGTHSRDWLLDRCVELTVRAEEMEMAVREWDAKGRAMEAEITELHNLISRNAKAQRDAGDEDGASGAVQHDRNDLSAPGSAEGPGCEEENATDGLPVPVSEDNRPASASSASPCSS